MRLGRKATTENLVVYLNQESNENPPRFGLVVSKSVGNAVQRNLVKRRSRAVLSEYINKLPSGSALVIRALPGVAELSWTEFNDQLEVVLTKLTNRLVSQ